LRTKNSEKEINLIPPEKNMHKAYALRIFFSGISDRSVKRLYYPKEVQYDEDDDDYDQNMNPRAKVREAWKYIRTDKA
jgi:hypothetical protein